MSGYDLKAGGALAYGLKVYNFISGADVSFGRNTSAGVPMVLSGTPFLSYLNKLRRQAGVKVRSLTTCRKGCPPPLVNFRWKARPR